MSTNNTEFSFIDLFSGIGGFRLALENNGGRCLGFSEVDNDAIATYCTNFHEDDSSNFGDITQIKALPAHDLLTAGVPCQSWSIAGKNLGFDDDRGQLWNDTIYLLQQAKPKAFIFENVKGLVDPRNQNALFYILSRIRKAGYYANYYILNSYDYGVAQSRVRVYIVGFKEKEFYDRFQPPPPSSQKTKLADILGIQVPDIEGLEETLQRNLFGEIVPVRSMSLSHTNGFNDYFLFNDLRNGDTTVHSWDIIDTTHRQKDICYLLLRNRRKSAYGKLDGNPLSLANFQALDPTVTQKELDDLIELGILEREEYLFAVNPQGDLSEDEAALLGCSHDRRLLIDDLKSSRELKLRKVSIPKTLQSLKVKQVIECVEVRYDFKNTKISTGLFGINRIFLPSSDIFPTLVASDTNDYIALQTIRATDKDEYKRKFIKDIYEKNKYRKVTKQEACRIQGFPADFILPESRARWMRLIGNSVAVPVVDRICRAIADTGVFETASNTVGVSIICGVNSGEAPN
jgi:DNA (cytosine-5)-methyltransferase 1